MRTLVALLLLTSVATAGQNRLWSVRVIERTSTAPKRESQRSAAPVKLTPKLLQAMLDHSRSMAQVAARYGVSRHGNQAVVNAHQSFVAAARKRDSDAQLRTKYQAVVSLYEEWRQKDRNQTVTDRHGNPLNR